MYIAELKNDGRAIPKSGIARYRVLGIQIDIYFIKFHLFIHEILYNELKIIALILK